MNLLCHLSQRGRYFCERPGGRSLHKRGPAACSRSTCCQAKPMWDKLDRMIDEFFEGITLEDLTKEMQ